MAVKKPVLPSGMTTGDLANLLKQIGKVDVYILKIYYLQILIAILKI